MPLSLAYMYAWVEWILQYGEWNDLGRWSDTAVWSDS